MSDIRILSEALSNKIAAGEVVARPSSVVKELIENAIDARSSLITVEVESGGQSLIRVSDDGTGMTKDNALLSIERFATSKLQDAKDLFSISTMGFRGEALPSIAAVSKFTLITRAKDEDSGTNIIISGGKVLSVTETGAPIGTMVQVKDLFFNTPARKKFLKSNATEMSHIADIFSSIALGNKYVGFRLFSSGKLIRSFASSDSLNERAVKVLGKDLSAHLLEINLQEDNINVSGFISTPEITRSSSRMIRIFVNNRPVHDRAIASALFNGYRGNLMKSRFPLAVLYISLPYDKVDINVHPAKNEVRFFEVEKVCNVVTLAVKNTLDKVREAFYSVKEPVKASKPVEFKKPVEPETSVKAVQESLFQYSGKSNKMPGNIKLKNKQAVPVNQVVSEKGQTISQDEIILELPIENVDTAPGAVKKEPEVQPPHEKKYFIKGQVMSTYIIAETSSGMILVDQHAAHERIVYEKLKLANEKSVVESQTLLMPETLELGFREAQLLGVIAEALKDYGFDIEPFGGTTFIIKSVPAIIDKKETAPFILEMIDNLVDKKTNAIKNQWLDDTLMLMACHSAIRANHNMNIKEMEQLLLDLEKCSNPLHCPHGRPTMIKWSKKDVQRMFKRIV